MAQRGNIPSKSYITVDGQTESKTRPIRSLLFYFNSFLYFPGKSLVMEKYCKNFI